MTSSKGILIIGFLLTLGFSSGSQLGTVDEKPEVGTLETFSEWSQMLLEKYPDLMDSTYAMSKASCSTPEGRLRWVRMHSGNLQPPEALPAGFEKQHSYIARAYHNNMLIPGKYVPSTRFAYIPWEGKEFRKTDFEVLIGYEARWIETQTNHIPPNAYVAGYENNDQMYICRAIVDGTLLPGKLSARFGTCYVPWFKERSNRSYQILTVP